MGWNHWEVMVRGYGVLNPSWLDENILKLIMVLVSQSVIILRTIELYTLDE